MIINSVFSAFKVSLLDLSQLQIFKNLGIILVSRSLVFFIVEDILVSLAYIQISADFTAFGKSFIKIMNNRGPKMEPWGTPYDICLMEDSLPLTEQHCVLSTKYALMNKRESSLTP